MTIGLYSKKTAEVIASRVLGLDPQVMGAESIYEEDYESRWFFVKMAETLPPPADPETDYSTAKGNVVKYTSDVSGHDREEVTTESEQIDIINRNPFIFIAKGDYIWVREVEAEYVPVGPCRQELDAVLTDTLPITIDALTTPSTAPCRILHPATPGSALLVLTSWEETVKNRFKFIGPLDAGTYITIKRLNGEWRLSGADCEVNSGISYSGAGSDTPLGVQP